MSTILGSTRVEQAKRFGFRQRGGPYNIVEHKGTEAQIRGLLPGIEAAGGDYDVEQLPGDIWRVTANYGNAETGGGSASGSQITETWELAPKDASKPILQSYHSLVAGLTQPQIDQIRAEVDDPGKTAANTTLTGNSLILFKLMRAGVESTEVEQPVLVHSWNVPYQVVLGYAYANVGRLFSNSTLFSSEGVPGYLRSSISAWTSNFSNPTYGTGRINLVFGWKKRAPTQRIAINKGLEFQQTFEFGLWPTDMFGSVL